MNTLKILVILFLIFVFMNSCGSKDNDNSGAVDMLRIEIAVIPKGTTHEFWKSIHAGAQQAATEFGVKIL